MQKQQTTTNTTTDQTTFIPCDDCGSQCRTSAATRYDYTCPTHHTVYVCKRCVNGVTPITVTSDSRPWYQHGR